MKNFNNETFEINGQKEFFDKIIKGVCITAATYGLAKVIETIVTDKAEETADVEYVTHPYQISTPDRAICKGVFKTPKGMSEHTSWVYPNGKIHISGDCMKKNRIMSYDDTDHPDRWLHCLMFPTADENENDELLIVCRIGSDLVETKFACTGKDDPIVSIVATSILNQYIDMVDKD